MGNSLEVRASFADHELVDYVGSLPLKYKYRKNNPKWLLKECMSGIVLKYILNAPKKGFCAPFFLIRQLMNKYNSKILQSKKKNYNFIILDKFLFLETVIKSESDLFAELRA